jgi:hypothetical protein
VRLFSTLKAGPAATRRPPWNRPHPSGHRGRSSEEVLTKRLGNLGFTKPKGLYATKRGERLAVLRLGKFATLRRSVGVGAAGSWRSCGSRAPPASASCSAGDGLGGHIGTALGGMPGQDLGLPGWHGVGKARPLRQVNDVCPTGTSAPGGAGRRHGPVWLASRPVTPGRVPPWNRAGRPARPSHTHDGCGGALETPPPPRT